MTTTQENLQSSKLGTMPVGKLILTMSGPAILSMLVQALYNIVDSVFIGMYDATNGVLALSYAMPMQLLARARLYPGCSAKAETRTQALRRKPDF